MRGESLRQCVTRNPSFSHACSSSGENRAQYGQQERGKSTQKETSRHSTFSTSEEKWGENTTKYATSALVFESALKKYNRREQWKEPDFQSSDPVAEFKYESV